jgi:hypothetical protein
MADVRKREVRRVRLLPLTIDTALARAREFAKEGNVLLSFDVPLRLTSLVPFLGNPEGSGLGSGFLLHVLPANRCARAE